jgi:hypothetical protein
VALLKRKHYLILKLIMNNRIEPVNGKSEIMPFLPKIISQGAGEEMLGTTTS